MISVLPVAYGYYPTQHYSNKDGLSHPNVFRIFQDTRGFMWFCTSHGLYQYDGKHFQPYMIQDGLKSDQIMSLSETANGDKLICTYGGGLHIMNGLTIKPYQLHSGIMPKQTLFSIKNNNQIWLVALEPDNNLFNITNGNLTRVKLYDDKGLPVKFYYKIILSQDNIYLATSNGAFIIDSNNKIKPLFKGLINGIVRDIRKDKKGNYWIGLNNKLIKIVNNKITSEYPLSKNSLINRIFIDYADNVWLIAVGENILQVKNNSLINRSAEFKMNRTIINDLSGDNEGNLWIATHGEGLYRINLTDSISNFLVEEHKLSTYCKTIIPSKNDELIIGSMGTLGKIKNGTLSPFYSKCLHSSDFVYFAKIIDDNLYVGTPRGLIIKSLTNPNDEKLINDSFNIAGAISILQDKKGKIWVGNFRGLYTLENKTLTLVKENPNNWIRYNTLFQDNNGTYWFGTDSGVVSLRNHKYSFEFSSDSRALTTINHIIQDKYKRIWCATDSGLIYKTDAGWQIISGNYGQLSKKCNYLLEDTSRNLIWIGTLQGLSYLDLRDMTINKYHSSEKFGEVLTIYKNKNNYLYCGNVNGISIFSKNYHLTIDAPPPVYITSIATSKKRLDNPTNFTIPYNEKKIVIEFIGLSYKSPENIEYTYKIEGLDDIWHITHNTAIEFSSIPPGNYTFRLSARLSNGQWSKPVTLSMTVISPIWQKWWFITLATIFTIIVLYKIIQFCVDYIQRRKEKQAYLQNEIETLRQSELETLKSQVNPHFLFNGLNAVYGLTLRANDQESSDAVMKLSNVLRYVLYECNRNYISLKQEIKFIQQYIEFSQLRQHTKHTIHFSIPDDIDNEQIAPLILLPFVENAMKYGLNNSLLKTDVHISLNIINDNMYFKCINSKKNMATDKLNQNSGIGLKNVRRRLELLYPEQHNLHILDGDESFTVELHIKLK